LHMPLHTLAYTICGRFSHTGLIPVFAHPVVMDINSIHRYNPEGL
jgi:hypothetical protein